MTEVSLNERDRREYEEKVEELETKINALREFELSDDKAEEMAELSDPYTRDLHSRLIMPVSVYEDGTVDPGTPRAVEGGTSIRWEDHVAFCAGCGSDDPDECRRFFREFAGEQIAQWENEKSRYEAALEQDVPVWY